MALKLTDIDKIVLSAVKKLTNKDNLEDIGNILAEDVKKRTRLGRGVPKSEGETIKLKPLEPKTKLNRKLLKKQGKLTGPNATPAKSGLNQTGQMLESLTVKSKLANFTIELDAEGKRKAELVAKIDKQRFTFMNFSKAEVKRMIRLMEESIKNIAKTIIK